MLVAAGVFAFITMLGIVPRLGKRTGTTNRMYLYENMIVLGAGIGNGFILHEWNVGLSVIGSCVFGGFAGIYVGCLAMALAESLRVIPIFTKRLQIRCMLPAILVSMALGKMAGVLFAKFF